MMPRALIPWVLIDPRKATCQRCRVTAPLAKNLLARKGQKTVFRRAHKGCPAPARISGIVPAGPVPDEPLIDGGYTVREIPGHWCDGGKHLSKLPASSSPGQKRRWR